MGLHNGYHQAQNIPLTPQLRLQHRPTLRLHLHYSLSFCEHAKQSLEHCWWDFPRYNCIEFAGRVLRAVQDREHPQNDSSHSFLKLWLNILAKFRRVSRSDVGCGLMPLVFLPQQLFLWLAPTWEPTTPFFIFAHTTACGTTCKLMREVMKSNFFHKEIYKAWITSLVRRAVPLPSHGAAQRQEQLKPVFSPWEMYGETTVSPSHPSPEARPGAAATWNIASAGEPSWESPLAIAWSMGVGPSEASWRRGSLWTPLVFSNQVQSPASSCVSTSQAKQYKSQSFVLSPLSAQRIAQRVLACPDLGACQYCTGACSSRGWRKPSVWKLFS